MTRMNIIRETQIGDKVRKVRFRCSVLVLRRDSGKVMLKMELPGKKKRGRRHKKKKINQQEAGFLKKKKKKKYFPLGDFNNIIDNGRQMVYPIICQV